MNSFQTCRVVVIDDKPDEAQPVICALSKLGIGCVYFQGDRVDELPRQPLGGVALIILDMRLGDTGTSKAVASKTAHVFSTIIAEDNTPKIVLLWTRHADDLDAFKEALFATHQIFKTSLLVANLEKPKNISPATTRKVINSIQALAGNWSPMDFLWYWEKMSHVAAIETTSIISTYASAQANIQDADSDEQRRKKWLIALNKLLRTLSIAAGGKDAPLEAVKSDLLDTLAGLHHDQLEQMDLPQKWSELKKRLNVKPDPLAQGALAGLNSQLLIGKVSSKKGELRPGHVYAGDNAFQPRLRSLGVSWADLGNDILGNITASSEFRALEDEKKRHQTDQAKIKELSAKQEVVRNGIISECQKLLVEITPSCDFSQRAHKKQYVAKMAAGLLVPLSRDKLINARCESLKKIEPVIIPNLPGVWIPVLSGRAMYSVSMCPKPPLARASFRFRNALVTDLRNWYSARFSRSGYLSVR